MKLVIKHKLTLWG